MRRLSKLSSTTRIRFAAMFRRPLEFLPTFRLSDHTPKKKAGVDFHSGLPADLCQCLLNVQVDRISDGEPGEGLMDVERVGGQDRAALGRAEVFRGYAQQS